MEKSKIYPMIQAVLAALLFSASAPISKLLLGDIEPIPMAAFLYLGSGFGLLFYRIVQRLNNNSARVEAGINKYDIKWLIGAILAGGVLAPIVLMFGLKATPAATASLLLNFEGVSTTLIAALAFKEAIGRRIWAAVLCITAASVLLSWNINGQWGISLGALGVLTSCALWGIDNNFTRNISAKDPLIIVTVKGICAGAFSLVLALILNNPFPNLRITLGAMLLGSLSYGLSIVLFILAMRSLGAARTSAFFGTAPFVGVFLSFLLFRELPNTQFFLSLPLMLLGAFLILNEEHRHEHIHETIEHEHRHTHHDRHHTHGHEDDNIKEHSHNHIHERILHSHPHMPDLHHRHVH